ncbi:MAG: methyltransferase [Clostridia bacterium]|nr:methyltransferase [Clostridia bacterium]
MDRETVTRINSDLVIKEPSGGIRFGTDALLLAAFALPRIKKGFCIDLGTGSGVLPLLLLSAGSRARFSGLEIQPEYAEAAAGNAKANGFARDFAVICGSADEAASFYAAGSADHVITNPPYMRADCGRDNENPRLSVARREVCGGAGAFCRAAARCLKSGGSFFCVYRPDRLTNLLYEMRANGIEPKRLRAVFPSAGKKPSLILAEGKKDAAEGLSFESSLFIYKNSSHREYSEEMEEIYSRFSGGKRK